MICVTGKYEWNFANYGYRYIWGEKARKTWIVVNPSLFRTLLRQNMLSIPYIIDLKYPLLALLNLDCEPLKLSIWWILYYRQQAHLCKLAFPSIPITQRRYMKKDPPPHFTFCWSYQTIVCNFSIDKNKGVFSNIYGSKSCSQRLPRAMDRKHIYISMLALQFV